MAKSITDYIFRWLGLKFLNQAKPNFAKQQDLFSNTNLLEGEHFDRIHKHEEEVYSLQSDAPPCMECGSIMVRNGTCYKCLNCGSTSGCS